MSVLEFTTGQPVTSARRDAVGPVLVSPPALRDPAPAATIEIVLPIWLESPDLRARTSRGLPGRAAAR